MSTVSEPPCYRLSIDLRCLDAAQVKTERWARATTVESPCLAVVSSVICNDREWAILWFSLREEVCGNTSFSAALLHCSDFIITTKVICWTIRVGL